MGERETPETTGAKYKSYSTLHTALHINICWVPNLGNVSERDSANIILLLHFVRMFDLYVEVSGGEWKHANSNLPEPNQYGDKLFNEYLEDAEDYLNNLHR